MSQSRNYSMELENLLEALAESVIEMSDEQVLAEAAEEGNDIDKAAEEVRAVFKVALKNYKQRKLIEAQRQYEDKMSEMFQRKYSLPDSHEERRALLHRFLSANPQVGDALLTAQHREFTELSDEDVEGYLKQFIELGALRLDGEEEEADE